MYLYQGCHSCVTYNVLICVYRWDREELVVGRSGLLLYIVCTIVYMPGSKVLNWNTCHFKTCTLQSVKDQGIRAISPIIASIVVGLDELFPHGLLYNDHLLFWWHKYWWETRQVFISPFSGKEWRFVRI